MAWHLSSGSSKLALHTAIDDATRCMVALRQLSAHGTMTAPSFLGTSKRRDWSVPWSPLAGPDVGGSPRTCVLAPQSDAEPITLVAQVVTIWFVLLK